MKLQRFLIPVLVVLPPVLMFAARSFLPNPETLLFVFLVALHLVIVWELTYTLRHGHDFKHFCAPTPTSTVISALLDNEREVLLSTLRKNISGLLTDPDDEIIVVYRTEKPLPEEAELKALAERHDRLRVLKVTTGGGKHAQMNEAIKVVKNTSIRFLDADAEIVEATTLSELENSDIDFVQGANLIRNRDSLLARIAYVEYVVKYLIAQFSRNQAIGLTYFCGSNGTWKKEPIEALQFSSASLVEDVEVSLRASIGGYSGVFSPSLLTTELAPNKFEDWWHQRKRWAHGWFEAGALHSKALFYSGMPLAKILNWYYLDMDTTRCLFDGLLLVPRLCSFCVYDGRFWTLSRILLFGALANRSGFSSVVGG